jgi:peptide/nickel transport system permease protein
MIDNAVSRAGFARQNKLIILGACLVLVPVVFALTAPLLAPHDPNKQHLEDRLVPPIWQSGDSTYLLGTDGLGRDILSRIIYGARISLLVGVTVVFIGGALGTIVGIVSGYFGGWIDGLFMRIVDIFLAFPFLLLALAIMAILGPGLWKVIIVLGITSWVPYARVARAKVLSVKETEFIEAANALGAKPLYMILAHIVPNIVSSIIVVASFRVAIAIIGEATLSFLGLGVTPGTPSWGTILSEGRQYLMLAWWPATLPGLMIMITVLGMNLVGDGLRDFLDPKFRL